jgi:hypothetical protein
MGEQIEMPIRPENKARYPRDGNCGRVIDKKLLFARPHVLGAARVRLESQGETATSYFSTGRPAFFQALMPPSRW